MSGMSPARRGWKFRADNDEVTAAQWLRLAYGDEAASQVMGLSRELRESLYPDVLRWGPAGEQIAAFVAAVNDVLVKRLTPGRSWASLAKLSGVAGVKYGRVVGFLGHRLGEVPYPVYDGVSVVMRFLDGQYQFTAEDVAAADAETVQLVNKILNDLGLPALGGVFVGA